MKARSIAIVAMTVLLLATSVISISASTNNVFATYQRNQATSQANACGNEALSTNVGCQNTDSQIEGDENAAAITVQQTFPEVEKDHQRPMPPPKVGCPRDYVWDLTLNDPLGDLPAGTVLCSFNDGLGGSQTVQVEGTEEELVANIVEGDSCVISDRSGEGHASSGTPPDPLEIGDSVCVAEL